MSGSPPDIEQIVRSKFSVKESFALPDGELEFQVAYGDDSKQKFTRLYPEAAARGYRPELTGSKEECVLTLRRSEPAPPNPSRVPVVVALLTAVSLVVFGLLQEGIDQVLVPSISEVYVFFGFSGTVALAMAAHELSRRYVARKGGAGRSNSYLIPGVPYLTPFLPSLGFVATQRGPAVNRDRLFDVVIAGPLAMVAVSALAYLVGVLTSVQSAVQFQNTPLVNTSISINSNAIETAINGIVGPHFAGAASGFVQVSPIADGAAFGFVLAFICLLPMTIFDGGLLSNLAWGGRAARATTYLSVLLLLLIDVNYATYWATAIVALLLAGRPVKLRLLDEVSGVSTSRQWAFIGALVLAFLCLPVPHSLATIPLA